jgi:hypothetical protein
LDSSLRESQKETERFKLGSKRIAALFSGEVEGPKTGMAERERRRRFVIIEDVSVALSSRG